MTPAGVARAARIADDLARLDAAGVDQVLFSNAAAKDIDEEVRLLEELQRIVSR